jgi:hypothetical protein
VEFEEAGWISEIPSLCGGGDFYSGKIGGGETGMVGKCWLK